MKTSKITKSLLLISVVVSIFDVARLDLWGTTSLLYLIWNLMLAWIPYIISVCFIKKDMRVDYFVPLFIIWLLFFPNAPYLVTDVSHIVLSLPQIVWYDSLMLFFFGWIGLLLGMLSLFQIHQYLKAHFTYLISELGILAICLISSFGIYLGRFERWNSWDIFLNPLDLMKHSLNVSTNLTHPGTPLAFVVFFTMFMYSIYRVIYILITDKIE